MNNPVALCDSDGLRCVINHRGLDSGKPKTTFSSDGRGKSDELLEKIKPKHNVPKEYTNYQMKVCFQGRQYKSTDHSLDYADFALSEITAGVVSKFSPKVAAVLGVASAVDTAIGINDASSFPDGYYDTYKITTSWTETYKWDGGTTNTYHSYDFIVCWDTVSNIEPGWQLYKTINNTYSEVIFD